MLESKLTLEDKFWFGRYSGRDIAEIIEQDSEYVEWCAKNVKDFDLDENCLKLLEYYKSE